MNFDITTKAVCVVPEAPVIDARCSDAAFALAHPDLCSSESALILKPAIALLCLHGVVQFRLFEFKNGIETEITSGATFSSSSSDSLAIGVNSGNATAQAAGNVIVSASYGGKIITAQVTVLPGTNCCDDIRVLTSIVVDNSRSMTLGFGGSYPTRLNFAKAAASSYGGNIIHVSGIPKDADGVWTINQTITSLLAFSDSTAAILAAIGGISQTQQKTDLLTVFSTAAQNLLDNEADTRVLFLISDGEHTDTTDSRQSVLDAASVFKAAGGIVVVVGVRASGNGYDLLERLATGGFFINATSDDAASSLLQLNYLKNLLCAGDCVPEGDDYVNLPELNYTGFQHWEIVSGTVDLLGPGLLDLLPGNGLYVRMNGGSTIRTISTFPIIAGRTYRISFDLAGNQLANVAGGVFKLEALNVASLALMTQTVSPAWNQEFVRYSFSFTAIADDSVRIYFTQTAGDAGFSRLLDRVQFDDSSTLINLLTDEFDDENPTYIPPACGPSSGLPAITDPSTPSAALTPHDMGGTVGIDNGEAYTYSVSWLTLEGETAESLYYTLSTPGDPDTAILVTLPPAPPRVISVNLWRNVVDSNVINRFLLVSLPPSQSSYVDIETHADFLARYDNSVQAPTGNNTAVPAGSAYGYYCIGYDCLSETPGVQSPDASPLPDIESGFNPPVVFTSTKEYCATCPAGFVNAAGGNLIPVMTSNTTPSGEAIASAQAFFPTFAAWQAFGGPTFWQPDNVTSGWIGYHFPSPVVVSRYEIQGGEINTNPKDFTFEGSNNGSTWVVLDTRTNQSWYPNELKSFPVVNTTSYSYYRLNVTTLDGPSALRIAELRMFSTAVLPCATRTETSFISQQDADNKALAAAQLAATDLLNCVPVYTATENHTAYCPVGTAGGPFTRSATRTSLISQGDAEQLAQAAAQADAEAARDADCTGSNNTQRLDIPALGPASLYPSVKFVSGLSGLITKVTLTLKRFNCGDYGDVNVMLVSPAGTKIVVMSGAMNGAFDTTERNITFDDTAGSFIPQNSRPAGVDHTFKPAAYEVTTFPSPAPNNGSDPFYDGSPPYYSAGGGMNSFIGENPNGGWALYIYDDLALNSGYLLFGWDIAITTA